MFGFAPEPVWSQGATPQTLSWQGTTNIILTLNTPHSLGATSSSGLPVTLRVEAGPAELGDGTIILTASGTVWVAAEQAGDSTYAAARLTRSFNVRQVRLTPVGDYDTTGQAESVQVVGSIGYIADFQGGLQVVDLHQPSAPVRIGQYDTIGYALDVQVVGNLAYVADTLTGVQILDVSTPSNPVRVGGYDTSGSARAISVAGNFAYVADEIAGLQVLDVGDPGHPGRVGGYETKGSAGDVQVEGTHAYVVDGGVQVIDVSSPADPVPVSRLETSGHAVGIQVAGRYAYVADYDGGLKILDVSAPTNPVQVGEIAVSDTAHRVFVEGNYAYVADSQNRVRVVDISHPGNPVPVGESSTQSFVHGLQVVGSYAYAAVGVDGLQVFKVTLGYANDFNFAPPTDVAITNASIALPPTSGNGAMVHYSVLSGPAKVEGDRLHFTGPGSVRLRAEQADDGVFLPVNLEWTIHVHLLPQTLTWQGTSQEILSLQVPYPLGATASSGLPVTLRVVSGPAVIADGLITVTGAGTIVVSAGQFGDATYLPAELTRNFNVRQVSVTPVGMSYVDNARDVRVVGNYAFVAGDGTRKGAIHLPGGFFVIDVSQPAMPVSVGAYRGSLTNANSVQIVANYAFVTDGYSGLHVLDVSDRARPQQLGGYLTSGSANDVQVSGKYAYVTDWQNGLQVLDVSNPFNPVKVGEYKLDGGARAIGMVGSIAFVGDNTRLRVINGIPPANPSLIVTYNTANTIWDVQVRGEYAYAAIGSDGLEVLNLNNAASPRTGGFDTGGFAYGVYLDGNYAYVADGESGLQVLDITNPKLPVRVGGYDTSGTSYKVMVVGNHAYVAEGRAGAGVQGGLKIFELRSGFGQTLDLYLAGETPLQTISLDLVGGSSSGLPLVLSVVSGPAIVMNRQLILTGLGPVTLRAEQSGDADFLPVSAEWTFTVTPPRLGVRTAGAQVEVYWPSGADGFQLQARETLLPGSPWENVNEPPSVVDGEARVTLGTSGAQRYLRLFKP